MSNCVVADLHQKTKPHDKLPPLQHHAVKMTAMVQGDQSTDGFNEEEKPSSGDGDKESVLEVL